MDRARLPVRSRWRPAGGCAQSECPLARHFLACVLEFTGHPGEALPHLEAILRLDPHYRFRSLAIADQSLCHLLLDNLGEAISTAEKALRIQPGNVRARQRLVAALSLSGLDEMAQELRKRFRACSPHSTSPTSTTLTLSCCRINANGSLMPFARHLCCNSENARPRQPARMARPVNWHP